MNSIAINRIHSKRFATVKVKSPIKRFLFGVSIVDLMLIVSIYFVISIPQAKFSVYSAPAKQVTTVGSSTNSFIKQLPYGFVLNPSQIKRDDLSVSGQMIVKDGDNFEVFEYSNSALAEKEASLLAQKYQANKNSNEWKANVHIYVKNNLLIFYMGSRDSIISALSQGGGQPVMGNEQVSAGYLSAISKSGDYYK